MMKKWFSVLAACLLPVTALALQLNGEQQASVCWPEDAGDDAVLVYTAAYPCFAEDSDAACTINETYRYLIEDAVDFTVPIVGEMYEGSGEQHTMTVSYDITCMNDDYLSVRLCSTTAVEGEEKQVLAGHTFALQGNEAGNVLTLAKLLGIFENTGNDTWLEQRQTAKANELVWTLLWEAIEDEGLDDELDEDTFRAMFFPEEDFYLTEEGSIVFFLQPGLLGEEPVSFAYSIEELLDEL